MEITEVASGQEVPGGFEIVLSQTGDKSIEVTVAADGKILEEPGSKKDGADGD